MFRILKPVVAALVALTLATSCTPAQVDRWFDDVIGHNITREEATDIAKFISTQDCLPEYGAEQYIECAISDMAERFDIPRSHFASVAWCESRLNPYAENRYSSASGLYQFLDSTWNWTASRTGQWEVYNARHAAFNAAWLWVTEGSHHWSCA